jgi:predicted glycosyltransferase
MAYRRVGTTGGIDTTCDIMVVSCMSLVVNLYEKSYCVVEHRLRR